MKDRNNLFLNAAPLVPFVISLLAILLPTSHSQAVTCTNLDANNDGNPDDCSGCPIGQYTFTDTSTDPDTYNCKNCNTGFFSGTTGTTIYSCATACSTQNCGVATKLTECTTSADRVCTACDSGFFQSSTSHTSLTCSSCSTANCGVGTKLTECTTSTDRLCSACEVGYFQTSSSHASLTCTLNDKCEAGKYILVSASASAQRVCLSCGSGQYSSDVLIALTYPLTGAAAIVNGGVGSCSDCPTGCKLLCEKKSNRCIIF